MKNKNRFGWWIDEHKQQGIGDDTQEMPQDSRPENRDHSTSALWIWIGSMLLSTCGWIGAFLGAALLEGDAYRVAQMICFGGAVVTTAILIFLIVSYYSKEV